MTLDEVERGGFYECLSGGKKLLVIVDDILPSGVLGRSDRTGREIFVKTKDVERRILRRVTDVSDWKLHNGE